MSTKSTYTRQVVTSQYEISHGRKPSGRGAWAFSFHGPASGNGAVIKGYSPSNMLYSEAKSWARAHAASIGAQYIVVLA